MCVLTLHTSVQLCSRSGFVLVLCLSPLLALSPDKTRRLVDPAFRALLSYLGAPVFILVTDCSTREAGTTPGLRKQLVALILCLLTLFI